MKSDHQFVLVHDVGTTGNKACLYQLGDNITLVNSHLVGYPLYVLENGGVEQKVDEWWAAITESTKQVIQQSDIAPDAIQGMAFCAQMQGFVPVDRNGTVLRNPMSYMDSRSTSQIERYLYNGLIKINGWNAFKLLRWLQVTGGAAVTVKDPLWKYHWVRENEPDVFAAMHCWMDVKDYLVQKATGEFMMGAVSDKEAEQRNLYHLLNRAVDETRPGSNGVIFTPWLHGNRSPFEDPLARGMFFNIGLETGKRHLIRAVLEGVAYHKRWMVETIEKKVPQQGPLRFVGGGAQSDVWAQILADVTGRKIEVVANPQNSGALGAAIVCAVGLGVTDFSRAERMIKVEKCFTPQPVNHTLYEKQYQVYKQLHKKNKELFGMLNG